MWPHNGRIPSIDLSQARCQLLKTLGLPFADLADMLVGKAPCRAPFWTVAVRQRKGKLSEDCGRFLDTRTVRLGRALFRSVSDRPYTTTDWVFRQDLAVLGAGLLQS